MWTVRWMFLCTSILVIVGCNTGPTQEQIEATVSARMTVLAPTAAHLPSPTPTSVPHASIEQSSDKDGMSLLYVPAGEFTMGSNEYDDEKPPHKVYLDTFWIDQTEVTNAMFKQFVTDTSYRTDAEKRNSGFAFVVATQKWEDTQGADWQHPHGPNSNLDGLENHPVVQVSWNDAKAYCQWAGGDLPTEAQWEKAARGDDQRQYPWGDQAVAGNLLNFADRNLNASWADKSVNDGYQFTAPADHYHEGVSPYGALDMAGNVWEWVADWYDIYPRTPSSNPSGPNFGDGRVLRGGAWNSEASATRASSRAGNVPDFRIDIYGFRCAR